VLTHRAALGTLVVVGAQRGGETIGSIGPELLGEVIGGLAQHRIGHREDGHRGSIILFEGDAGGAGEVIGEVPHVGDGGGPKGVDGLGIVAHCTQVGVGPAHAAHDVGLDWIGVLVFVDEDMVEQITQRPSRRARGEAPPEQQEVVVVEDIVGPLAGGVGGEDRAEVVVVVGTPRIVGVENIGELGLAAHHA